jgi:hypothetical protein
MSWKVEHTTVTCMYQGMQVWTISVTGTEYHPVGERFGYVDGVQKHQNALSDNCTSHSFGWGGNVSTSGNHDAMTALKDSNGNTKASASTTINCF